MKIPPIPPNCDMFDTDAKGEILFRCNILQENNRYYWALAEWNVLPLDLRKVISCVGEVYWYKISEEEVERAACADSSDEEMNHIAKRDVAVANACEWRKWGKG